MKQKSYASPSYGKRNYNMPEVEFWVDEQRIEKLTAMPALNGNRKITVAVVVLFLFEKEGQLVTVVSTERDHEFDTTRKKTKLPAAMMEDCESFKDTLDRRITQETGLKVKGMKVCCAAKISNTLKDGGGNDQEDHYKVCILVEEVEGELNEGSVDEVQSKKYIPIKDLRACINLGQLCIIDTFFAKVMADEKYAFRLLNVV